MTPGLPNAPLRELRGGDRHGICPFRMLSVSYSTLVFCYVPCVSIACPVTSVAEPCLQPHLPTVFIGQHCVGERLLTAIDCIAQRSGDTHLLVSRLTDLAG